MSFGLEGARRLVYEKETRMYRGSLSVCGVGGTIDAMIPLSRSFGLAPESQIRSIGKVWSVKPFRQQHRLIKDRA